MEEGIPQVKRIRICLMCNKEFKSKAAGHRICVRCRNDFNKACIRNVPITPQPPEDYNKKARY